MKTSAGIFRHLWAGALFLVLFSCRKSMTEDQADLTLNSGKKASATTLTNTTVYAAGVLGNQAVYWKHDGTGISTTILPGGYLTTGIHVAGSDVHVSGYALDPMTGDGTAMYWLNGNAVTLPKGGFTGDSWATGVTVLPSGDVYVAGFLGRYTKTAVYWLNGVLNTLPAGGLMGRPVAAPNGDVYVPDGDYRSYLKNGNINILNALPNYTSYNALGLAVDGTNVYVVGSTLSNTSSGKIALYWKNGAPTELTSNTAYYEANDVAVHNGIAYISGFGGAGWDKDEYVGIWVNGLPGFNKWGTKPCWGHANMDIDAAGNIYVSAGEWEDASHLKAKYWVNGVVTDLTDGSVQSYATDIDVVQ